MHFVNFLGVPAQRISWSFDLLSISYVMLNEGYAPACCNNLAQTSSSAYWLLLSCFYAHGVLVMYCCCILGFYSVLCSWLSVKVIVGVLFPNWFKNE